jgi:hypothetical protein
MSKATHRILLCLEHSCWLCWWTCSNCLSSFILLILLVHLISLYLRYEVQELLQLITLITLSLNYFQGGGLMMSPSKINRPVVPSPAPATAATATPKPVGGFLTPTAANIRTPSSEKPAGGPPVNGLFSTPKRFPFLQSLDRHRGLLNNIVKEATIDHWSCSTTLKFIESLNDFAVTVRKSLEPRFRYTSLIMFNLSQEVWFL